MNDKFWAVAAIAFSITALLSIIKLYFEYKLHKARRQAIKRYDPRRYHTEIWDCPKCEGRGLWREPVELNNLMEMGPFGDADGMVDVNNLSITIRTVECPVCGGTGKRAMRIDHAS